MNYKKVEALLEIEIVKDMTRSGNYAGARAKLLEVKRFIPDFDDISEMINVCDILYSAGFRFLGCGSDWYWVLRVEPDASQSTIHYQYKKFTTLLEPIRNSFPGTKSALEIVQDAFLVLSDPEKRLEFDMKRAASLRDYGSMNVNTVASKNCYGDFYNFDNNRKAEVFYVGQVWAAYDEENMPRNYAWINSIDSSTFKVLVYWLEPAPLMACERRWCEVGLPVACGYFDIDKTHQTIVTSPAIFSHMSYQYASPNEKIEIYPQKHEIWAIYKDWKPSEWILDPEARKDSKLQIVEILKGYSNKDDMMVVGLVNVKGFRNIFKRCTNNGDEQPFTIPAKHLYMFSHKLPAYRFSGGERDEIFEGMFDLDPLAVPAAFDCMAESSEMKKSSEFSTFAYCPPSPPLPVSSYPEAESLKCKRPLKHFVLGEVWAVNNGSDSMPRQYVVVDNVISGNEVKVTFLEPHPMLDDEIYWIEERLPIVCGSFRTSRTSLNLEISQFSHLVNCEWITDESFYKINPKKGEIWALYKNWNSRWKQSEFSCCQCRIVEIITDYCDKSGLIVASLEEVPGYTTFFQRQLSEGFELIRAVPLTEMLSFSHRIPAFTIPGIGIHGIPEGSWHLEADALPPNHYN